MIIRRNEAPTKHLGSGSALQEYHPANSDCGSLAYGRFNGILPSEDSSFLNRECNEWYFVQSGEVDVHIDEEPTCTALAGDAVLIERGKPFWVDAKNLEVLLVVVPKWSAEQHEVVRRPTKTE